MLFYRAALPLSRKTLAFVARIIRRHRAAIGSLWRKLDPARQALLVLAYLRKGETLADLAAGFGGGVATTVAAGRNWHEHAWRLEWYARARITGSKSDWQAARAAADAARHAFYESARSDLSVSGGSLPDNEEHDVRVQRIRGGHSDP
jgi:hypothetical protein